MIVKSKLIVNCYPPQIAMLTVGNKCCTAIVLHISKNKCYVMLLDLIGKNNSKMERSKTSKINKLMS